MSSRRSRRLKLKTRLQWSLSELLKIWRDMVVLETRLKATAMTRCWKLVATASCACVFVLFLARAIKIMRRHLAQPQQARRRGRTGTTSISRCRSRAWSSSCARCEVRYCCADRICKVLLALCRIWQRKALIMRLRVRMRVQAQALEQAVVKRHINTVTCSRQSACATEQEWNPLRGFRRASVSTAHCMLSWTSSNCMLSWTLRLHMHMTSRSDRLSLC